MARHDEGFIVDADQNAGIWNEGGVVNSKEEVVTLVNIRVETRAGCGGGRRAVGQWRLQLFSAPFDAVASKMRLLCNTIANND